MSGETKFDPHKLDLGQLKTLRAASPDMYEALEAVHGFLVENYTSEKWVAEHGDPFEPSVRELRDAVCNALAKARGGSQ